MQLSKLFGAQIAHPENKGATLSNDHMTYICSKALTSETLLGSPLFKLVSDFDFFSEYITIQF